jgi:dTMP kinase
LDAVFTREPGATALGTELRGLLLGTDKPEGDDWSIGPRAEALMMAADRAQHLREVVIPALSRGRHVVSDRSAYSSLAYQGGGRELGIEPIRQINEWAVYGRWPDVVVYLRVDRTVARDRLGAELDRLEREDENFHRRVMSSFERLAAADPDRWLVIDANRTVDEVADEVWRLLEPRIVW